MRERVPCVVIVGGGFGGLAAAKALRKTPVRIILVDRTNHHLFQPLLYQVATSVLNPAQIGSPIRGILRGQENVMAASDNEYPYTTQSVTGETPVPRWLRGMAVPAMTELDRFVNLVSATQSPPALPRIRRRISGFGFRIRTRSSRDR